jgi:hypothetical protein
MSEAFLSAVIDTVVPGEAAAPGSGLPLPAGTKAGLAWPARDGRHAVVLRLIAERSGGEDGFIAASPAARTAILADVESESFDTFRALVVSLLQDYYETPAVLAAIGWRTGGAQPLGHKVPEADDATLALLERVRARGPIWREVTKGPR